jgi:hypothetical protein
MYVKGSGSNVGRIWGYARGSADSANNYAFDGIVVQSGCATACADVALASDPANNKFTTVTATQVNTATFWTTATTASPSGPAFSATTWHIQNGWLPVLAGFGDYDAQLVTSSGYNPAIAPITTGGQNGLTPLWLTPVTPMVKLTLSPGANSGDSKVVPALANTAQSPPANPFTLPTGTTFAFWCKSALEGSPTTCPSADQLALSSTFTLTEDMELIAVYKYNSPSNADFTVTTATDKNTDDGSISGVTDEYEYSIVGNSATLASCASESYTTGTGTVTGLSAGGTRVCVRKRATDGVLASDAQRVIVPVGPTPPPSSPASVEIHRLHNPVSGEHHYTKDEREIRTLVNEWGWRDEGVGWTAPRTGTTVYRMHNPVSGEHHYTKDAYEISQLVSLNGWVNEGVGWYSGGSEPVYRLHNPVSGEHHYTKDTNEIRTLVNELGWINEDIGWWSLG